MIKKRYIPATLLLSVLLFGSIVNAVAQTATVSTKSNQQEKQESYELRNLKNTNKLLMEYIENLKLENNLLKEIDTTFIRIADLTFDGIIDSVVIHISGKSLLHPFVWNYKIISEGKVIYYKEYDSSGIDLGFGYNKTPRLEAFLKDKSSFYFENIPESIIRKEVHEEKSSAVVSKKYNAGIYYLLPKQLRELGISDEKRMLEIIDRTAERLKKGAYILQPDNSNMGAGVLRIFVPEVNTFLIIYSV